MAKHSVFIRFSVRLTEPQPGHNRNERVGPTFFRWLPEGKADAISLPVDPPGSSLAVWFERRGHVDGRFIKFDWHRREVDASVMVRQAVLDAGPLVGHVEVAGIGDRTFGLLTSERRNEQACVPFAKRLVALLFQPLSVFVATLRDNLGQTWIEELHPWDPSRSSVAGYCTYLGLRIGGTQEGPWAPFAPGLHSFTATLGGKGAVSREFITESDWSTLRAEMARGYVPSAADRLLSSANSYLDLGQRRLAVIEGVSALELAISDAIRRRTGGFKNFTRGVEVDLERPPLATRLITIATPTVIPLSDLEAAVRVIALRNQVVHHGETPPPESVDDIRALFRSVAALLPGPRHKFPTAERGWNWLESPDADK